MIQNFCDWLAATALSQAFANTSWFVPTVQSVHILAIGALITMLGVLNLRLLRLTRSGPPLQALTEGYIPWVWTCLVVLLLSGALLTITEPARELLNFAFRLKMIMVAVLVVLTFVFQAAIRKDATYWTASPGRRLAGGTIAVVSILLCITIVAAGRLIAYV